MSAIRNLHNFGLFPAVFKLPSDKEAELSEFGKNGLACMEIAQNLLESWPLQVKSFSVSLL